MQRFKIHKKSAYGIRLYKSLEVMFFEDDRQQTMLPRRALIQSDEGLIAFSKRAGGPRTPEHRAGLERMVKRGFGEVFVNLSAEQYWKLKHLGTPCRR